MTDRAFAFRRSTVVSSEDRQFQLRVFWSLATTLLRLKRRRMAMNEVRSPTVLVLDRNETNQHVPYLCFGLAREQGRRREGAGRKAKRADSCQVLPWPHESSRASRAR
jgi:hypothetical protein